jgi:two-component system, NarL family, invasion response regulator UvrY
MVKIIKVLIADDHSLVRTGIRRMIDHAQGIEVIGEANSGEEAIKIVKANRPDVILMDIKMSGMGGLEATRRLSRTDPDIKVLVLTVCDNDLYPSKLLQAGAAGYLTKNASMDEMLQAIRAIHVGQRYISPDVAQQLAFKHLSDKEESIFNSLSERELQVMTMITHGCKAQKIAEKLNLSAKTINSYRYRIFEKLDVRNDVELTLLAIRHGLVDSALIK